jgi:hypothetical protein
MHRLPSHQALVRLRLSAFLFIFAWLFVPLSVTTLVYSLVADLPDFTLLAAIFAAAWLVLMISQSITASRTRCPLCMVPPLAKKSCSKHRDARKLLGSYRLRAAMAILFRGRFRCPYCNEPTEMAVRTRRPQPPMPARHRPRA